MDSTHTDRGEGRTSAAVRLAAAALAGALGLAALAGWALDIEPLKSVASGWVTMKANTAICLILCAGALALLAKSPSLRGFVACVLAGSAGLVAAATLAQYLFKFDAGIDALLFQETARGTGMHAMSFPGRMAPATAFALLAFAAGVCTRTSRWPAKVKLPLVHSMAASVLFVGAYSLCGYAADSLWPTAWWAYSGVAAHTGAALAALGVGLFAATRPGLAFRWHVDAPTTTAFVAGVGLMVAMGHLAFARVEASLRHQDLDVATTAAAESFLLLPLGVMLGFTVLVASILYLNAGLEERDAHAREAERVDRLYAALSRINRAIVGASDRFALFDEVCRALVEAGGFRMVWVGVWDPADGRMKPAASAGESLGYLDHVEIPAPPGSPPGPIEIALRQNAPYICNDITRDERTRPWRAQAARSGFCSAAAFPMHDSCTPCAMLNVYAGTAGYFQDREIALLEEVSSDVSAAIEALRIRVAHREAEARAANERRFSETMIASMPGILYLSDRSGRFLRWNRPFEVVSGYSGEEIAGMHPKDFFREEDRAALAERVEETFVRGESSLEAIFRSKDGSLTPFFFTGRRVVFDGEPCLVGVGIDVSERVRAEAALRASELRYRTTLDGMIEGCQILDPDLRYLYINAAAERHNRRPSSDLLGRTMRDAWPGIEGTAVFPLLRRCLDEGVALHDEIEFTFSDGTRSWFDVRAQPTDGGIFVLSIDISQRKRAEADLIALTESLERRVADRTQELEALNAELEAFCHSVSHDLRPPLRGMAGFAQILSDTCADALDESSRDYLRRILAAAERMGFLIDDLLKLSRVTRDPFRRDEVDLSALASEIVADLRNQDPGRDVVVEIEPALRARADGPLVRVLLDNLLGNAWKFTSKAPDARIAFRVDRSHGAAVFCTSDNGAGFDMKYSEKLFAPFQRLHRVLDFPGTGIGLATAKRVVHRHGGRIWVDATEGKGATFRFTLQPENALPDG